MKQFLLTLLLTTAPLLPATAQDTAEPLTLAQKLDTLVKYKLPQGSNVGIAAYDLTEERVLYSHQADKLSRPASTMKLLTTITALNRKEADEPFRTEVWAQGIIERDTLRGNLYVVGGMDPELDENALDSLAAQVTRAPFKVIEGYVCGDVSLRDSLYWGSGWLWDDNPYDFQPYLSPLMLCKGVVTVTAMPTAQGDTARLKCSPRSSYYTVGNRTQSRTPAAGRFKVDRNWLEGGNRISVSGNVSARQTGKVNVAGCERFFLHTFMERLQEQGIACREYKIEEHRKDSVSRLIAIHETPVQAVVNQIMKESDNLNAEAMLTRLGAQATGKRHISATDGLDAVRALIKQLGYNPDRYKLADGCGCRTTIISRRNCW